MGPAIFCGFSRIGFNVCVYPADCSVLWDRLFFVGFRVSDSVCVCVSSIRRPSVEKKIQKRKEVEK